LPRIEVGDYTLVEDDTMVADMPPSTNLDFQNPTTLFTIELQSQTYATSTCRDLYYAAKEIRDRVSKIKDNDGTTDSRDETENCVDLEGNFDLELDEEDIHDINIRD
jgi:hypothetical protein